MRRLVWKELREKRLLGLLVIASTVALVFVGALDIYVCDINISPWMMLPMVAAFLLGSAAFANELAGESANFLYSRPVGWKRVFAAKLLVGITVLIVSAVVCALVMRLFTPAPYHKFMTLPRLTQGSLYMLLWLGGGYLAGFICSAVLPGVFGGVLLACSLFVLAALHVAEVLDPLGSGEGAFASMAAWVIGPLVATILIARFGLTFSLWQRLSRFALITLALVILSHPFNGVLKPDDWFRGYRPNWDTDTSYGPAMEAGVNFESFFALNRGPAARVNIGLDNVVYWATPTTAIATPRLGATAGNVYLLWLDAARQPRHRMLLKRGSSGMGAVVSPSGRYALLVSGKWSAADGSAWTYPATHRDIEGSGQALWLVPQGNYLSFRAVDLTQRKMIDLPETAAKYCWWQSDNQIGYIDLNGRRQILTLQKLAYQE